MLFLTSPAKTLDLRSTYPAIPLTTPLFLQKTTQVFAQLEALSLPELQSLLHVSEDLALLNFTRYKEWQTEHTINNSRPSIFTFNGDVFKAMDIAQYSTAQLEYCNDHLLILSGFYGALRPFDLMQPYRLEMGTKMAIHGKNLPNFWQPALTEYINATLQQHTEQFVLNLASQEYSSAVDTKTLAHPMVHVTFLQKRNGETKTFGILAKKARGMMIDYCIHSCAKTLQDVQQFNYAGYMCIEANEKELVFKQS